MVLRSVRLRGNLMGVVTCDSTDWEGVGTCPTARKRTKTAAAAPMDSSLDDDGDGGERKDGRKYL